MLPRDRSVLLLVAVLALALLVRVRLLPVESLDYQVFLRPWYERLAAGGLPALGESFSNYNSPYLVLLALLGYTPLPPLIAIKLLSIGGDVACVVLAARVVRVVRPKPRWAPLAAAMLVALLPTVVLNGSAWGQCDGLYAALCLGSLSALLAGRAGWSCALFGLALAFKLQAVFFAPVLLVGLVLLRPRPRKLVAAPVAFLLALVPAWLAGRGLVQQLLTYPRQVADSSGTGTVVDHPVELLTYGAPTPYAWLAGQPVELWRTVGVLVAGAAVLALVGHVVARRRQVGPEDLLVVAACLSLVAPLLLPGMHERYFYLAEVLSVLAAFVDRRFVWVAGLLQLVALDTYLGFLAGVMVVPLPVAALGAVVAGGVSVAATVARPAPAPPRYDVTFGSSRGPSDNPNVTS